VRVSAEAKFQGLVTALGGEGGAVAAARERGANGAAEAGGAADVLVTMVGRQGEATPEGGADVAAAREASAPRGCSIPLKVVQGSVLGVSRRGPCPSGTQALAVRGAAGQALCVPCPAGSASSGGGACVQCKYPTYAPYKGSQRCLTCPSGRYPDTHIGGTRCEPLMR
jgi:hypothetical protein